MISEFFIKNEIEYAVIFFKIAVCAIPNNCESINTELENFWFDL